MAQPDLILICHYRQVNGRVKMLLRFGQRGLVSLVHRTPEQFSYRHKVTPEGAQEAEELETEEKEDAEKNSEAARLWISGIEAVKRKLDVRTVFDLSATPFFLRGSGYAEGTLFPWTVCDFSLMDAIECGIVKLPRVPVADNVPSADVPIYRELWKHIGKKMPKKGRGKSGNLDPLNLPTEAHRQTVARRWLSPLRRRHLSCPGALSGNCRHGL